MRTLHRALIAVALTAVVVAGLGALEPWNHAALAQHGQPQHEGAGDSQDHFDVVATRLELTSDQRQALAGTFEEAMAAMQELHRLHDVIAAQLNDGQKEKLAELMHEAMGGSTTHQSHRDHGHGSEFN